MKKYIILSICLIPFISLNAFAAENFYVGLDINEKKAGQAVSFSLEKAVALYGEYDSSFDVHREDASVKSDYILETYSSSKELIGKYDLLSSRFIYVDSEGGGGMIESDEGTINAVIPYDRTKPTEFVKIDNKGSKTDFISLPVAQLEEDFKKITLCKKEGEETDLENNHCCSSLIPAQQDNGTFVCVNCGDGKCSQFENYNSCYKDCPLEESQKSKISKNLFLLILTVILSLISAVLLVALSIRGIAKLMKRKKKNI
ncbi:MAG: hypothetical protein NTW46_01855 [Candidatus Nealsonbacteria bacterium]|nr:hypothetical protein [Candidatus Nealsonbacteria bacterium]